MDNLTDIKDHSPNESLVKHIEEALEQAKSGELRSIVWAKQWDDNKVASGWALDDRCCQRLLLAGLVMLQHEVTVNIEMKERDSVLYKALDIEE